MIDLVMTIQTVQDIKIRAILAIFDVRPLSQESLLEHLVILIDSIMQTVRQICLPKKFVG